MNIWCKIFGHSWCHWNKRTSIYPDNTLEQIELFLRTHHRKCNDCDKVQHWVGGFTYGHWKNGEMPDEGILKEV